MNSKIFAKLLVEFEPLKWVKDNNGSFYAAPEGLRWEYRIDFLEDGRSKLFFIDKSDNQNKVSPELHHNSNEAQESAMKHYLFTLNKLFPRLKL